MANIVVIGSANIDVTHRITEFPDVISRESLNAIEDTRRDIGGKGANQALAAALQSKGTGTNVSFIGCLGSDGNAKYIVENVFENENEKNTRRNGVKIDYSGIKYVYGKTDGRIIFVDRKGNNMMYSSSTECIDQLTTQAVFNNKTSKILESADIIMIQMKMPDETIENVINYCTLKGKTLIVDPTPVEKSSLLIRKQLLDKATYLTPNEDEAFALALYEEGYSTGAVKDIVKKISKGMITREFVIEMIEKLVKKHPNIIATLGDKGIMYNINGGTRYKRPYNTKCIDSTGAGDTFNGTFAAAIARGENFETALDYAVMASSVKVAFSGAQNGIQTFMETMNDLNRVEMK